MLASLALAITPLMAGCASTSASTPPVASAAPQLSETTLRTVTTRLASDEFEGRSPGTAGEERTVAYLIEQFRAAGLQPGNNGSWTQDVPLVEITASNVSPLTFTTPQGTQTLAHADDFVAGSYRITPQTRIANSDVVFVGYGINAPERDWNDYAGIDVRGKTVVILVNDPDWQQVSVGGQFNGRAMTYYGRWTYKFEEAARQGAAAAIIVHDTEPAAYGWNVVRSSWTGPQYVQDAADNHMDETQANGWIQLARAQALFAAAGQDFNALRDRARQPGFRAVPLTGVQANLSFDNSVRRTMSRNVIGILPGRTRPNEYVLHTAHWDHLGRCEANAAGDDICNGAVDNATGTAALVTLAQEHARVGATDRSLVFLAVTAEESGLLGSKYYAENPVFPLAQTVGGLNMDALSPTGPARDVTVIGRGKSELEAYLTRALAIEGRTASDEPTPEKGYYYRSDHFSFAKLGVPMLYFDAGEDLLEGGTAAGRAAAEDYTVNRYHGPEDEVEAITRWDGMIADLRLFWRIGRELGNSNDWPNWLPGDEFRAARDQSRAGR
ncbi:M28 family peptidase [Sphingomonas lacunae]|uniref:M28 family peptidase n=2 Tax=Sphingomonas lacunae TaxID=2698828 RepID=A0A6M4AZ99_9SPHN|nr:M28 family peptidase [Sphingomonas lacunae]